MSGFDKNTSINTYEFNRFYQKPASSCDFRHLQYLVFIWNDWKLQGRYLFSFVRRCASGYNLLSHVLVVQEKRSAQ